MTGYPTPEMRARMAAEPGTPPTGPAEVSTPPPTKTRPGDQPLPTGGRECVQDALIAKIEERKQLGIQRYGSVLMTHNGRDAGRDMVEEAVDLAMYSMQVAMELRDLRAQLARAEAALHARFAHPDFEYATTTGPRKQWDDADRPPADDDGDPDPTWERNVDAGRDGWERWDYTEESYWRRRKQPEPADTDAGQPCEQHPNAPVIGGMCGGCTQYPADMVKAPAAGEDDDPPVQCWHYEPGSPCDWDVCRQPERLAAGDRGTDPANAPRSRVSRFLDALTHSGPGYDLTPPASAADEAAPEAAGCLRMETRTCPPSYAGPCGDRPCARFESDDPTLWLDSAACPAVDEDAQRTTRRDSLRNLLTRVNRGPLSTDECALLWRHVEAETREVDTARAVAAGNKRHVQIMYADLQQAHKERDTADRIRAEAQRDRDQHAAVLAEVLAAFVHKVDGYRIPRRSAEVDVATLEKWRIVVAPTVERPWWEQLAEMRAVVKRVRQMTDAWEQRLPETILTATAVEAIRHALDGAEQPRT